MTPPGDLIEETNFLSDASSLIRTYIARVEVRSAHSDQDDLGLGQSASRRGVGAHLGQQLLAGLALAREILDDDLRPELLTEKTCVATHPTETAAAPAGPQIISPPPDDSEPPKPEGKPQVSATAAVSAPATVTAAQAIKPAESQPAPVPSPPPAAGAKLAMVELAPSGASLTSGSFGRIKPAIPFSDARGKLPLPAQGRRGAGVPLVASWQAGKRRRSQRDNSRASRARAAGDR